MPVARRRLHLSLISLLVLLALCVFSIAAAQDSSLPVPQETEYDLGFDCPASTALDPSGEILWVLMHNCGNTKYYVQGFNIADGTPVTAAVSDFKEQLAGLTSYDILPYETPFVFTPDGLLQLIYFDDNYDAHIIRLSLASGESETPSADSLNTLLHNYTEYPEQASYSNDHTRAVAWDDANSTLHVLDLVSGSELFEIKPEGGGYTAFAKFSADGNHLYVTTLNNPDDMEDYTSVLTVYSLPDGEVLNTYDVPSFVLYISPDEKYAVASLWEDNDSIENFVLVELATGAVSDPVPVSQGKSRVTACVNDGRDMSDVDFTTSGRLPIRDLEWLPDSSGFVTIHSYGGEGTGGGAPCFFNHSRLRSYAVGN